MLAPTQPRGECPLRAARDHVQQPGWTGAVPVLGQVDDHAHILIAPAGVPPDMLIDPDAGDPVKTRRVLDQYAFALGQEGIIRGMSGNTEPGGDAGDDEVIDDRGGTVPTACRCRRQFPPPWGGRLDVLPQPVTSVFPW